MADTPLSRGRVGRHVSLDSPGVAAAGFFKTFGDRRWRWPVIDYVASHVDFDAFLARCRLRERRIIEMKLEGYQQIETAAALGVTPAAVCQWLGDLRMRWEATEAA